jgi:phosphoribosylaminoimidazole carboxylase PurE protein
MSDKAIVGVVMGSDSDLELMGKCLKQLEEFGIGYEVRIISAHRTPDVAHEYSTTAAERGLKCIVAAAGMSAALAGVMAAGTTLPVIGVPVASGPLSGFDAALSTMQMPPGIPVACMAINGAKNAAILAAQIVATADESMAAKMAQFKADQAAAVKAKDQKLQQE